jgi:glycosyltransferase involved in cell wall biosynthesis
MSTLLLEGPFESDYSLAIVNRRLALAILRMGISVRLHQRDNTTPYFPTEAFLESYPDLAPLFARDLAAVSVDVHSRYIYPPYVDGFLRGRRVVHCYGWEESAFPRRFVQDFNGGLDLITVMSEFVRDVLHRNGVRVPIEVVGLGADHILSQPAKPVGRWRGDTFDFLHVSSCFPRKAPEILIRAFCAEFTRSDDVRLIIKTFANPHNDVIKILNEIGAEYPRHAPIEIAWESLDIGEMRHLYERAGCLVSASRGEGFGLPVAEAMIVGCPVIATVYSGQADICNQENCWPVQYELAPASTHLTEGRSLWANPIVDSVRAQMRTVYKATVQERLQKTEAARQFVMGRYTWDRVAALHWKYCQDSLDIQDGTGNCIPSRRSGGERPDIGFVTTWNTRCGIAEYTRYLATNLPGGHQFAIFANRASEELVRPDEDFVTRCWEPWDLPWRAGVQTEIEELLPAILKSGVRAVSIQHNFNFFRPAAVRDLIRQLRQQGIIVTLTMHGINHPNFAQLKPALKEVDFCVCHRQPDVDNVRRLGVGHVVLQKQGVIASQLDTGDSARRKAQERPYFLVSCFGFFLPPKGIHQLIQAFALAKAVQPLLRLKLLNSLYPIPESTVYARACMRLIRQNGLGGDVQVTTAFLDHEETLRQLTESDLLVLPYLHSTESSSAAGAFAIASLTPVLCSDIPLFDELAEVVHRFPAGNVHALANRILQLADDREELLRHRASQEELVRKLAWPAVARDFADLIAAQIARQKSDTHGEFATALRDP